MNEHCPGMDPLMPDKKQDERSFILACYTLFLAQGSTLASRSIKATTMRGYHKDIDALCTQRHLMSLRIDSMGQKNAHIEKILAECERWEKMPDKREPVTHEMLEYIISLAKRDPNPDSVTNATADWIVMGMYAGFRKSESFQDKSHVNKGTHERAIDGSAKAFTIDDFSFRQGNNRIRCSNSHVLNEEDTDLVYLTWRYQKNGNNGEEIPFSQNEKNQDHCFVRRALRIRRRAQRLKVRKELPVAVCLDNGKVRHISHEDVERIIRLAAGKVHNASKTEQLKWGTHSIRVGALVRLQLMGQPEHFIQSRLRWKSERWKEYLRNLPQLAKAHNNVVNALAEELAEITTERST
mmetsp:Transcript_29742/g.86682  ORF Transcript_29742/g.86682 Transcript_29742/m.86682 type:complete len:352 (-) Transcript_29742:1530-2585(-)